MLAELQKSTSLQKQVKLCTSNTIVSTHPVALSSSVPLEYTLMKSFKLSHSNLKVPGSILTAFGDIITSSQRFNTIVSYAIAGVALSELIALETRSFADHGSVG
jgi:hypothetical protein